MKSGIGNGLRRVDGVLGAPIRSVEFRNVHFSYGGQPILRGLNLTILSGDLLGISGHSGKGKTTILNLLLGFLTPDKGESAG